MNAQEKNKIKCKEYYHKTKNNLSEEVKQKRREQTNERVKKYYHRNKELCKLRIYKTRTKKESKLKNIENLLTKYDSLITENEIKLIKRLDLLPIIKKAPRLKMWSKKINEWTFKDFEKLETLMKPNYENKQNTTSIKSFNC
jgi:hypothetical protein